MSYTKELREELYKFITTNQSGMNCVTGYALSTLNDNAINNRIEQIIFDEQLDFFVDCSSLDDFDQDFNFTIVECFSNDGVVYFNGFDQENNFFCIPINSVKTY
jgi:hypothetical protein